MRVVRLADILAAVDHDDGLARHGLAAIPADLIFGGLLPLIQARHQTGPVELQRLNLKAVLHCAWQNYFQNVASSQLPVTQV